LAKLTTDEAFRGELVSTADWLRERADRFEIVEAEIPSAGIADYAPSSLQRA
jgi:hypothetical protein